MARKSDTETTTAELTAAVPDRDWAAEATDNVVRVVDVVKAASTTKVQKAVKYIVYGVFALFIAIVAALWLLITLFRFVDNYLPPADSSWSTWLVFGVVFTLVGIIVWVKRGRLIPKPA
ncbi:MAG: hypothetical protein AAFZ07_27195 [Actinomycetota bacterium]